MAGPWDDYSPKAAPADTKPWEQFQAKAPEKGFGEQLNDFVADVPRTLGRTARVSIQGVGGMLNLAATPFRAALNAVTPDMAPTIQGQITGAKPRPRFAPIDFPGIADSIGLPRPRPGMEAAADSGAEMLVGGALPIGAGAALARTASPVVSGVGRMLASNPGQQLASAGAAGLAGGYTRETGGNETSQMLASLGAGIATPFAMNAASRAGTAAQGMRARPAPSPQQIDITINNAIERSGITLGDLPTDVAQGMRNDVAKAFETGGSLSPDAVRRLADYRLTGATPTRAGLTLNPADVTQQRNLAKLGINSKDQVAQQLGQTQNANNRQMTAGLNGLGAATTDDAIAGSGRIMGALDARNTRAKDIIDNLYQRARDTEGRSAALDPHAFSNRANDLLDEALLGGKLPADVRNLLNKAATGQMPLTVDVAEQFKTRIGDLQRASQDAAERKALGMVRGALDDTPLQAGQEIGQQSIDAFNKARGMNRSWMGIVDRTPALAAVRDGIEPDKFVNQFIVGAGSKANAMDVAMLKNSIKGSPDAMDAVRGQITAFLKQKALSGAADEVGNFSQSAYNKALNAIGDRKLALFFEPSQINQMKAIGRVASYEQFQPVGSAVNNSNTAGAVGNILDRLGSSALLSKIPLGKMLQDPIQNISVGMQAKQSLNVPNALTDGVRTPLPRPPAGLALSPAVFMGQESDEDRKRREAGLPPLR